MSAQSKLVAWVKAQIGYHEGSGNANKYAAMAQEVIGWNTNGQPWCSVFVAAAFSQCFGAEAAGHMLCSTKGNVSAAVSNNAAAFNAAGRIRYQPEIGDQVFYNGYNHTGIVVEVNGSTVVTVDGNYSDAVTKRSFSIGTSQIAAYGRPIWDYATDDGEDTSEESTSTTSTAVSITPENYEFKKGDLVSVNAGSSWYVGGACPAMVYNHNWYVLSQFNDRVVLNASDDGAYHIMSPIAASNLTLVKAAEEEDILKEVEEVTEDATVEDTATETSDDEVVYSTDKEVLPASDPPTMIIQADQRPSSETFGIGQILLNKIRNLGGHIA